MNEIQTKINVHFRIIPFGHASIVIKGHGPEKVVKEKKSPVYLEPKTTSIPLIQITFNGEKYTVPQKNYTVPKTTCGIL